MEAETLFLQDVTMHQMCRIQMLRHHTERLLIFLFLCKVSKYLELQSLDRILQLFIKNSIKLSITPLQYHPIYTAEITFSWFFVGIFHWQLLLETKFNHLTQIYAIAILLTGHSLTVSITCKLILNKFLQCSSAFKVFPLFSITFSFSDQGPGQLK